MENTEYPLAIGARVMLLVTRPTTARSQDQERQPFFVLSALVGVVGPCWCCHQQVSCSSY